MSEEKRVLAFDFGASSGRAMLGTYKGDRIEIEEVHRFSNDPVFLNGTMYWDILRLLYEIKQGLIKAKKKGVIESIGIDTWGVDFGLIDEKGNLLENPVHYRDERTKGMLEESFKYIPKERLYEITGNQFMELNTAFQLLALKEQRPELLERANSMLLTPDLFNYFLTGNKAAEYTIASTTQLLDAKEREWSKEIIQKLGFPESIFEKVVPAGTKVGALSAEICEELGVEPIDVIAIAGHDTQCAMAAVPTKEIDFIFISCGTWSLIGTELEAPLINEKSEKYNISNEGGYDNKASFLKNIIGLWLVQESRRQWIREGNEYEFGDLEILAKEAKPFQCFIDPDDEVFTPAGNIPRRIREYCEKTGQYVPQEVGEIVRCINESLAMKYRMAMEEIVDCTGKEYQNIHMLGGGVQSKLLCALTASACARPVIAGPIEATVFGNVLIQLIADGQIRDLEQAREVVANSPDIIRYEPQDGEKWEEAYKRFKEIIK